MAHISLGVADLARAGRFYDAVRGTLGFRRLHAAFAIAPDGYRIDAYCDAG